MHTITKPFRVLLTLTALLIPTLASAVIVESLDDATIHGLYDEQNSAVRNGEWEKLHHFVETRLDPGFRFTEHMTATVEGNPPSNSVNSSTKEDILKAIEVSKGSRPASYEKKITGIHYSDDHQTATIDEAMDQVGTMQMQTASGAPASVQFTAHQACVTKASLKNALVTFLQSDCTTTLKAAK